MNLSAQDCYQVFYQKGIEAAKNEEFESAINNFKAAKVCSDKPSENDVDDKIVEAQNGYINAIQKERKRAQSLALTAKSILELQKNDNASTAFRYAQYALSKDDNTESRAALYEAAYQLESENKRLLFSKSFTAIDKIYEHVKKVDFSQNGKYITVFSSDWEANIFDLEGNKIATKKTYNLPFNKKSFSADDKKVMFVGKDDHAYVYDFPLEDNTAGRLRFIKEKEDERIESMSFSPAGNFIAIGYKDGITKLFKQDGTLSTELSGFGRSIKSLSFSEDDSLLVTANNGGVVSVWNTNGSLMDTITIYKYNDTEVVISPDKRHFLASSADRKAVVFTIDGVELFATRKYLWDLTEDNFSPKGEFVALGNEIYNLREGGIYGRLVQTLPEWVRNIRFSKNNMFLVAVGYEKNAQIWKRVYNEWKYYGTLGGHDDDIASAAISPDGNVVVTASYDSTVKLWPIATSIAKEYGQAGKLLRSVISEDSTYVVTHKAKDIYLWNAKTGYNAFYGMPVDDIITQSDDGKMLLTVEDERLAVWKFDPFGEGIESIASITTFRPVKFASFSKNKKALAKFKKDEIFISLEVWDLENQKTRILGGGYGNVSALEWTSDDSKLLVGNSEGEVIVWNYKIPIDEMDIHQRWVAHKNQPISHIATSSDGRFIATASWDNTAKLWDANFEYQVTLKGHTMEINTIAFSADNQFVITASEDRTAKIWDTKGQLIVTLEGYRSDVKRADFSPNMDYVVTNYGDGTIKIWPFNPTLVIERITQLIDVDLDEREKEKYGIE